MRALRPADANAKMHDVDPGGAVTGVGTHKTFEAAANIVLNWRSTATSHHLTIDTIANQDVQALRRMERGWQAT